MYIDDPTRIRHMLESANEAVGFAAGKTVEDVHSDRALALVLVKCLEMMGEAAFKTSRNLRDAHSEVPWRTLIDLRNHLVHEYHDIDTERVWQTVTYDVPSVIPHLAALLRELESNG